MSAAGPTSNEDDHILVVLIKFIYLYWDASVSEKTDRAMCQHRHREQWGNSHVLT